MFLKTRFILTFGLGGVAFLFIITALVFYKMELAMELPLKQQFEGDAQSRIESLNQIFSSKTKQFQSVARLPMFKSMRFHQLTLNKPAFKNDVRQMELYLLDLIKQNNELSKVQYINTQGTEIFRVNQSGIQRNLYDFSANSIINEKLKMPVGKFELTDDLLSDDVHYITWWVPVFISNSKAYGILAFSLDYQYFLNNIADLKVSNSEMVCLFNSKGVELISSDNQVGCASESINLWKIEKSIDLKGLGWKTALSVDPESFLGDVNEVKKFVFGLIFPVVAVLAFLFTAIFSGHIVNAIKRLVDASEIMGKGEKLELIEIDRNDELGQLAEEMNRSAKLIEANRDKLEEKNRDLEAYSYTLAHDLRSPLRSITSFTQVLEMNASEKLDDEEKSYLDRIINASKRMSLLIDDILELSRISNKEVEVEDLSLSSIAESVTEQLRAADDERNVNVNIDPDLQVKGDKQLLRLVLENLLGNAWKYSGKKEHASIKFSASKKDNETIYSVVDNGVGFEMEFVGKLFKPFQRLHTSEEFEGTGIGLASVKRMIERHNGDIWIESVVDEGTTVNFTLWNTVDNSTK